MSRGVRWVLGSSVILVALAGWVVYALLMFGVAMAVMYVDVIAEWVGL